MVADDNVIFNFILNEYFKFKDNILNGSLFISQMITVL